MDDLCNAIPETLADSSLRRLPACSVDAEGHGLPHLPAYRMVCGASNGLDGDAMTCDQYIRDVSDGFIIGLIVFGVAFLWDRYSKWREHK